MGEFVKCEGCGAILFAKAFFRCLKVCAQCGQHHPLTPDEWIDLILEEDTFSELYSEVGSINPLGFPELDVQLEKARIRTNCLSAVKCGSGSLADVNVALIIFDARFVGGSIGSAEGEKIARTFEFATRNRMNVIGIVASGGARVQEGLFSLMQMPKIVGARYRHSEGGLRFVAHLTDPSMAGALIGFAMTADAILAEPGARVAFSGARVTSASREWTAEDYAGWGLVVLTDRRMLRQSLLVALLSSPDLK